MRRTIPISINTHTVEEAEDDDSIMSGDEDALIQSAVLQFSGAQRDSSAALHKHLSSGHSRKYINGPPSRSRSASSSLHLHHSRRSITGVDSVDCSSTSSSATLLRNNIERMVPPYIEAHNDDFVSHHGNSTESSRNDAQIYLGAAGATDIDLHNVPSPDRNDLEMPPPQMRQRRRSTQGRDSLLVKIVEQTGEHCDDGSLQRTFRQRTDVGAASDDAGGSLTGSTVNSSGVGSAAGDSLNSSNAFSTGAPPSLTTSSASSNLATEDYLRLSSGNGMFSNRKQSRSNGQASRSFSGTRGNTYHANQGNSNSREVQHHFHQGYGQMNEAEINEENEEREIEDFSAALSAFKRESNTSKGNNSSAKPRFSGFSRKRRSQSDIAEAAAEVAAFFQNLDSDGDDDSPHCGDCGSYAVKRNSGVSISAMNRLSIDHHGEERPRKRRSSSSLQSSLHNLSNIPAFKITDDDHMRSSSSAIFAAAAAVGQAEMNISENDDMISKSEEYNMSNPRRKFKRRGGIKISSLEAEAAAAHAARMELLMKDRYETRKMRNKTKDERHHARRSMSYTSGIKMASSIISSSMPEDKEEGFSEPHVIENADLRQLSRSRMERRVLSLPDPNAITRLSQTSINEDVDFSEDLSHKASALSVSLEASAAAARASYAGSMYNPYGQQLPASYESDQDTSNTQNTLPTHFSVHNDDMDNFTFGSVPTGNQTFCRKRRASTTRRQSKTINPVSKCQNRRVSFPGIHHNSFQTLNNQIEGIDFDFNELHSSDGQQDLESVPTPLNLYASSALSGSSQIQNLSQSISDGELPRNLSNSQAQPDNMQDASMAVAAAAVTGNALAAQSLARTAQVALIAHQATTALLQVHQQNVSTNLNPSKDEQKDTEICDDTFDWKKSDITSIIPQSPAQQSLSRRIHSLAETDDVIIKEIISSSTQSTRMLNDEISGDIPLHVGKSYKCGLVCRVYYHTNEVVDELTT